MKLNNYQVYWMYLTESGIKSISSKMNRKTRCIIKQNDEILAVGETLCSQSDMFSKETGRKISFGRALKELYPTQKEKRAEFWNEYRIMPKKKDSEGNIKIIPRWKLDSKKIAKEVQDVISKFKD